jgi:NAD(P)-dependent dehydrogenase (short-subunit alcohol dehydrogenase family)
VRLAAAPGTRVEWIPADFSVLDEVVALASTVSDRLGFPTLILHCAAVVPAGDRRTVDGFETQWAVNHLAPFLLSARLPVSPAPDGGPGRVVIVSSKLHRSGSITPSPTLFSDGPYDRSRRYCDTKLANVLFARALARRVDAGRAVVLSAHPGVANTGLSHDLQGTGTVARTVNRALRGVRKAAVWGLADCVETVSEVCLRPFDPADHGGYWEDGGLVDPSPAALDDGVGEALWRASERAVEPWLP